ncbi:MAG: restriction endonuclease [Saprospiraceae bacterium]|nr:restriction endonuclease [Saprospiraceae bacterium]
MIPDYQSIMLPLLKKISNGKVYKLRQLIDGLSDDFGLTEEEQKELLPSGQQPIFDNRVGWANTYMKKAGLVKSEKRGYLQITDKGKKILTDNPKKIDVKFLRTFPEFIEFSKGKRNETTKAKELKEIETEEQTPEEMLEYAHQKLMNDLSQELIETIKTCSPNFFERLVIDLLLAMGYGGSRIDAGKAIGKSNDGGIDGIIKEDKLGLDIIYVQAKRWENTVPTREVRDFAGALLAKKAKKGIFITTSDFPNSAIDFVNQIEPKLILIDGRRLGELIIEFDVGVSTQRIYKVKRIDSDYFEE